ncbi:MAG: DUF4442 domain-containing protein [Pseudobdellovibrionaceae bacterium]|jgi:hypothetical protein
MKESLKLTFLVNALSWLKIPLLAFCAPKVIEISDQRSVVRIGLGYRTKNHLNVMYFGALAMGAELSIALKAVQNIQKSGKKIDFIFKDFHCEFLKRADGDVHFICEQAGAVAELIEQSLSSKERLEGTFHGAAFVAGQLDQPIMKYSLTLSVRNRGL